MGAPTLQELTNPLVRGRDQLSANSDGYFITFAANGEYLSGSRTLHFNISAIFCTLDEPDGIKALAVRIKRALAEDVW
jgi:hypothetical protein